MSARSRPFSDGDEAVYALGRQARLTAELAGRVEELVGLVERLAARIAVIEMHHMPPRGTA